MKNAVSKMFGSVWSGLLSGIVIGLAVVIPVATTAQTEVTIDGSLQAANTTASDATYKNEVSATYNQVVKLQAYYANTTEKEDASNIRIKFALPNKSGSKQEVVTTIKGSNTNQVTDTVTISVDKEDAVIQFIPGTAVWKHNTGTADQPKIEETVLSDEVVTGSQGSILEPTTKAGQPFAGTVTIQARVLPPGVNVTIESQVKGETNKWSANNSAKPGQTLRYILNYQNTSGQTQSQVVARAVLPAKATIVPGSVMLYNTSNPNGIKIEGESIATSGTVIGNYGPGANAYVTFEAVVAAADQLSCGTNSLRAVGAIRPQNSSDYHGHAVTSVNRDCNAKPAQTPQAPQASATCNQLTITKAAGRAINAKVEYTANNGAKLKTVSYNFGDNSQPLVTDKKAVDYTYQKDGTFTVTATLTITANGKDSTVTSEACSKQVTVAAATDTTASGALKNGEDLPNSGPGSVAALFAVTSIGGYLLHWLLVGRRKTSR